MAGLLGVLLIASKILNWVDSFDSGRIKGAGS